MKFSQLFSSIFVSFLCFNCSNQNIEFKEKSSLNDPFSNSIVTSQSFDINGNIDNVIEGNEGTLLVIPKGSFVNASGELVKENINIELAEALSFDQMILSNLTTTSDGKILETDGMIYVNAMANNKQLKINPDNPIYIEIPTNKVKPNMMAYKGIRDKNGNMNWVEPKALENSLIAVDIFSLDFLPKGFKEEVEKGLPFRNFKTPSDKAVDSLYYYLEVYLDDVFKKKRMHSKNTIYEGYYNSTITSLESDSLIFNDETSDILNNEAIKDTLYTKFGVSPIKIKALKTEKFQNTLIATREFEKRLQVMFKICRPDIIDMYVNNIDKNMWELDSIVASILEGEKFQNKFTEFYNERKTKLKGGTKKAELLSNYYKQRRLEVEADVQVLYKQLKESRSIEIKKLEKLKKAYKTVLKKREKHRMETYGFEQTELGWVNIDRGTVEKDWESQSLEVLVKNGKTHNQVFTYIFYKSIKSLYRLNSLDNELFFVGNETSREMLIPKYKPAVIITIAYQNDKKFLGVYEFETNTTTHIDMTLLETSDLKLKKVLNKFETNGEENSIETDLKFMNQLSVDKTKKELIDTELEFLNKLISKSYPLQLYLVFDAKYQIDIGACDPNPQETIPEEVPAFN